MILMKIVEQNDIKWFITLMATFSCGQSDQVSKSKYTAIAGSWCYRSGFKSLIII